MDNDLLNELVRLRAMLSKKLDMPEHTIYNNAKLEEMAITKPQSIEDLLQIKNIPESKAVRFGKRFIEVIKKYS